MHVREGSDRGEYRVLNHDPPLRLRYGQVFEGSIEMVSIYESPNTHHPWKDLYAPACVDESAHHALGTGTREEPGTLTQGAPVFPTAAGTGAGPTDRWLLNGSNGNG